MSKRNALLGQKLSHSSNEGCTLNVLRYSQQTKNKLKLVKAFESYQQR